jgi:four helix bundle protein
MMKDEVPDLRERTTEFALRVLRMFVSLPKTEEARVLGKQVLRSGTSVGANYREAQRARSKAEFIAKIGDSLKELDETSYWLELLVRSEIVPQPKLAALRDETDQLLAIFTTISKKGQRLKSSSSPLPLVLHLYPSSFILHLLSFLRCSPTTTNTTPPITSPSSSPAI